MFSIMQPTVLVEVEWKQLKLCFKKIEFGSFF